MKSAQEILDKINAYKDMLGKSDVQSKIDALEWVLQNDKTPEPPVRFLKGVIIPECVGNRVRVGSLSDITKKYLFGEYKNELYVFSDCKEGILAIQKIFPNDIINYRTETNDSFFKYDYLKEEKEKLNERTK